MPIPWIRAAALAAVALAVPGRSAAQDAATAFAALVERADVIVQARTSGVPSGNAAVHRYRFTVEARLLGEAPAELELSEPAGRACGRALGGLAPGSYLLFLVAKPTGLELAVSGARCVAHATAAALAHVRALVAAATPEERVAVLAAALESPSERIRHDAVLVLPYLPDLPRARAEDRARIAAAVRRDLAGAGPAVGLLIAADRLRLTELRDDLLDVYLAGRHPHLEECLRRAVASLDGEGAAQRLAAALPTDPAGRVRAALLLRELPAAAALEPLRRLFAARADAAAVRAGVALLALGEEMAWIERRAPPAVADAIRRAAAAPPRFRSVLKGNAR